MNSKDLWNLLERLSDNDIQLLITMSARYLEAKRNKKLKNIIEDMKYCINYVKKTEV